MKIGIPAACAEGAQQILQKAHAAKKSMRTVLDDLQRVAASPETFVGDDQYGNLAQQLLEHRDAAGVFRPRETDAPYRIWGTNLEPDALRQMNNACKLPVAVSGALMPDAHVGYGLPIGGVLATHEAVIPYAVGVDIACRMKMTVLDLPVSALADDSASSDTGARARDAIRHGRHVQIAAPARRHGPRLARDDCHLQDEGSRVGAARHERQRQPLRRVRRAHCSRRRRSASHRGTYLALLSHSGSRGTGAQVAQHYSRLARELHPELPQDLSHLAWLDLSTEAGQEYWAAMELMGGYAAANHALIHALHRTVLWAST